MRYLFAFIFLLGCKQVSPFPDELLTVVDISNKVCRDYKLIDSKAVIFDGPVAKYSLGSDKCKMVFGYRDQAFKNVQNWIRDSQAVQAKVYHRPDVDAQLMINEGIDE